jgi:hypothetical protein
MEDPQPKIKMTPILINNTIDNRDYSTPYFIYKFSNKFKEEFGIEEFNIIRSDFHYLIRSNERFINVFKKLGSKESSIEGSTIITKMIPEEFKNHFNIVKNRSGIESVLINYDEINKGIFNEIVEKDDYSEELKKRVKRVEYIKKNWKNSDYWEIPEDE